MKRLRIGVVGAGLIGRRHIATIAASPKRRLRYSIRALSKTGEARPQTGGGRLTSIEYSPLSPTLRSDDCRNTTVCARSDDGAVG